jgi:hypothetical protein
VIAGSNQVVNEKRERGHPVTEDGHHQSSRPMGRNGTVTVRTVRCKRYFNENVCSKKSIRKKDKVPSYY